MQYFLYNRSPGGCKVPPFLSNQDAGDNDFHHSSCHQASCLALHLKPWEIAH